MNELKVKITKKEIDEFDKPIEDKVVETKTKPKIKKNKPVKIRKLFLSEDFVAIKKFIQESAIQGVIIVYALWAILNPFTWYSWFGIGLGFWFLENKLIKTIRKIFGKT